MMKTVETKIRELDDLKQERHQLPNGTHEWMLANCLDVKLKRHPRFINYAFQILKQINKFTCDPVLFCVADPERHIKYLQDQLEDVVRVLKLFKNYQDVKPSNSTVVRHFIISAPG